MKNLKLFIFIFFSLIYSSEPAFSDEPVSTDPPTVDYNGTLPIITPETGAFTGTTGPNAGWVDDCPTPHNECKYPDDFPETNRCNPECLNVETCTLACNYWYCHDPASTQGFDLRQLPMTIQYMKSQCTEKISDFTFRELPTTYDSGDGTSQTVREIPSLRLSLKQWACVQQPDPHLCPKACSYNNSIYPDHTEYNASRVTTVRAYPFANAPTCTAETFTCNNGSWSSENNHTTPHTSCLKQCKNNHTGIYTNSGETIYTYSAENAPTCSRITSKCTDGVWDATPGAYSSCDQQCQKGATYVNKDTLWENLYTAENDPDCTLTTFKCSSGSWVNTNWPYRTTYSTNCHRQCLFNGVYSNHGSTITNVSYMSSTTGTCEKVEDPETLICNEGSWKDGLTVLSSTPYNNLTCN